MFDVPEFSGMTVMFAFIGAQSQCQRCHRGLQYADRGTAGHAWNWQAHHKSPLAGNEITNCEILCHPCHVGTDSFGKPKGTQLAESFARLLAPQTPLQSILASFAPKDLKK